MNKNFTELLKQPSVFLPIVISTVLLMFIFGYTIFSGGVQQPQGDEGVPARIFQLGMVVQAVIMGYFAVKYISRKPKLTILILTIQVIIALLPIVLLIILESQ